MGEATKIEWADHTLNPWQGCSKVPGHPGCDNCYAERMSRRNPKVLGEWGDDGTRVKSKSFVETLRRWNRRAAERGVIETVFPSACDPFEDRPELEPWRREMFHVADECRNIVLILLTKRPENVRQMWPDLPCTTCGASHCQYYSPLSLRRENVWLLTSISDHPTAEIFVPDLIKLRDLVPVIGLSIEPLLGEIILRYEWLELLDWIIVGGESGPRARPMPPDPVRSLRDQAVEAGVPFFFKQHGEWCAFQDIPDEWLRTHEIELVPSVVMGEHSVHRIGKAAAGRLLDGRTWDEFPTVTKG